MVEYAEYLKALAAETFSIVPESILEPVGRREVLGLVNKCYMIRTVSGLLMLRFE